MPCGRQGVGATSRHRNRKASIQQLHCKRRKSANKLHKNTHHRDLLSIHCVRRNTCQGDLLIESHFLTCFSQCRSLLNSLSSLLQHRLGFTFWLFGHKTWETLAPRPEIEPAPPDLEGKVLTPGPPGKSQGDLLKWKPYFLGVSNGSPSAYRIKLNLSTWNSQPSFTCPNYMSTILVLEASPPLPTYTNPLSPRPLIIICSPTPGPSFSPLPATMSLPALPLCECMPAESLQLFPSLCNPTVHSPPGSSVPGMLQARNTGVGSHFLL